MTKKTNTRAVLITGNEIENLTNFLKDNNEKLSYIYFDVDQHGDIVRCCIETKAEPNLSEYKCTKEYRKTIKECAFRAITQTLSDKAECIKYTKIDN